MTSLMQMSAEEQETLLAEITRSLPQIHHPEKLQELALLGLTLLLRRAESTSFRDELAAEIKAIVAGIHTDRPADVVANETKAAAMACARVLEHAKTGRLTREQMKAGAVASYGTIKNHGPAKPDPEIRANAKAMRIMLGVGLTFLAAGGIALWLGRDVPISDSNEAGRFVEQLTKATQGGEVPATHIFGGALKLTSMNGVPVVIAQGVPPRICAASGMRLVKKGLLSVNGVTPTRVSSAIITELCNRDEGDATIMWAPK